MKKIVILLLLMYAGLPALCATRFYMPSGGSTAEVAPALSNLGWTDTASVTVEPVRTRLVRFKTNTAVTSYTQAKITPAGSYLMRQFVSDPIAAQSIEGTVQGEIIIGDAGVNRRISTEAGIYLVNNSGTYKSTLLALTAGTGDVPATAASKYIPLPGTTITTQTASSGDRIVVEWGIYKNSTQQDNGITPSFGDAVATSEIASGEGVSTPNIPWIEFSKTIIFPGARLTEGN